MSYYELQRAKRDNDKRKCMIRQYQTQIDCAKNDMETKDRIINSQQQEIVRLKRQKSQLLRKTEEYHFEKQSLESRYLLVLQKLQNQITQYKQKYNRLSNNIVPMMDCDSVRLKVLNEVQSNHQLELSNLKSVCDELKDKILRLRRENQVIKFEVADLRIHHEEEIRTIRNYRKSEKVEENLKLMSFQVTKDMENQLKLSYEQAKRQAEFYRNKYFAIQKKYQQRSFQMHQ